MSRMYKSDCRYFVGDRPCGFHKAEGITCDRCGHYDAARMRILLVKLGAMGDVLRTTSLLPTLSSHFDRPRISWLTLPESAALFDRNPLVDDLWVCDSRALARLQVPKKVLSPIVRSDFRMG